MISIISEFNKYGDEKVFLNKLEKFSFYMEDFKLGYKKDRELDDPVMKFIVNLLKKIPSIENKTILENERFIQSFYRIFWELISRLGVATQNFYMFVDDFVDETNRITRDGYVISDCHSTDNYNCGRAMIVLDPPKNSSHILVFNSDSRGMMDENTINLYLNCSKNIDLKNLQIKDLPKYYPKFHKRIEKEKNMLSKDFTAEIYEKENNGIKLVLFNKKPIKNGSKVMIMFDLPLDYPNSSPTGTFKDLTISQIDFDWSLESNLKIVVDKLINKYKNSLFPDHKEILCYLYILNFL